MSLRLDWCSHAAALYACEHWHYSKKLPVSKLVKVGVWEDGEYVGAVIFGSGSAGVGQLGKRFGVDTVHVCELQRVAIASHKAPVTKIVATALKMLRRVCPQLKLVVSYADPLQGHVGTIYQAGNWIYTGLSSPDIGYRDKTGKVWHSRSVKKSGVNTRKGRKTKCRSSVGMEPVQLPPKHRYMMPLDDEMRRLVDLVAKPYPKRPNQHDPSPLGSGRCDSDPDAPDSL